MGITYFDEKLGKGILEVKEALRQAEKHNSEHKPKVNLQKNKSE
nr:hypothetical protein [Aeromonas sp. Ne-1]